MESLPRARNYGIAVGTLRLERFASHFHRETQQLRERLLRGRLGVLAQQRAPKMGLPIFFAATCAPPISSLSPTHPVPSLLHPVPRLSLPSLFSRKD